MIKIGITGITGRMGSIVKHLIDKSDTAVLAGGIHSSSTDLDYQQVIENSNVVIDFSHNSLTMKSAIMCAEKKIPLVTGTTALSEECLSVLQKASEKTPIFQTSNFCIAIHLMAKFIGLTANVLSDFDASISEAHHKNKKDKPSGTAIYLQKSIAREEVDVQSIRANNAVGEHVVTFYGPNEKLVFVHEAFNREAFAAPAIKIASWIIGKQPKLYSMTDYINSYEN